MLSLNLPRYEIAAVDANGKRYEKVYDEVYNLIQEKDPLKHIVTYTYDVTIRPRNARSDNHWSCEGS